MGEHNKQDKPDGRTLVCVQFMPGISVSVGGKHTTVSFWDRKKLIDMQQPQDRVMIQEQGDGSVRITTGHDRFVRIVEPWAIAWRMYEPEGRK